MLIPQSEWELRKEIFKNRYQNEYMIDNFEKHEFIVYLSASILYHFSYSCFQQSYDDMDPTTAALEKEHEAVSCSFVFLAQGPNYETREH